MREVSELKLQLKMVEEARDGVRRELIDAHRKIREGEEAREGARKENTDLKRQLKDEEREKQAVQETANELRGKVKKCEAEKTNLRRTLDEAGQKIASLEETKAALQKEAGELRASLREVEKARLEARRELQQLHNQVTNALVNTEAICLNVCMVERIRPSKQLVDWMIWRHFFCKLRKHMLVPKSNGTKTKGKSCRLTFLHALAVHTLSLLINALQTSRKIASFGKSTARRGK